MSSERPAERRRFTGRTGRFGRQGVSINFVHDRKSFETMEAIRKALGKPIVRVDTSDFEQMEAVRLRTGFFLPRRGCLAYRFFFRSGFPQTLKAALKS